jgi:pyruvate kinase
MVYLLDHDILRRLSLLAVRKIMSKPDSRHTQSATKIIATLGPSSSDLESIKNLYTAGVNVFRLNFSHGNHEDHAKTIANIESLESELNIPIAIMADLQGPKLRVGKVKDNSELIQGQEFQLHLNPVEGNTERAQLPHKNIFKVAKEGHRLLVDDGKIALTITKVEPEILYTEVTVAGVIKSNKGVNVPDATLDIKSLTEKDVRDLAFAISKGIRIFALSFVQHASDIAYLRKAAETPIRVVSKLEKPAALLDLEKIVDASDAIMVARGDLGVELNPSSVPAAQRKIIRACRQQGKPVIVATQMLESMTDLPTPTRAEASDVANAVYSSVDAVMLSGETAAGKYPLETVRMMKNIIQEAEADEETKLGETFTEKDDVDSCKKVSRSISRAVKAMSESLDCNSIASFTTSGSTCIAIARERPNAKQIALTANRNTAKFLSFVWGAKSIVTEDARNLEDMSLIVSDSLLKGGHAKEDELVVITAGVPFGSPGRTNLLHIKRL